MSTEVALLSLKRSMMGFKGPENIFQNEDSIYRLFSGTKEKESPFDLKLAYSGNDFSI